MKLLVSGILLSGCCSMGFANTTVNFYAKDQHGSIAGVTDTSGNLASAALNQYNDYGANQSNASDNKDQISIHYDPYQYSGEYTDEESGLQPLGNGYRYYDPALMRFISSDSYPLLNLYAYVNGNPIMNVDPTGHVGEGEGVEGVEAAAEVVGDVVGALAAPELVPVEEAVEGAIQGAIQGGEAAVEEATDSVAEDVTQGTKRPLEEMSHEEEPAPKQQRTEGAVRPSRKAIVQGNIQKYLNANLADDDDVANWVDYYNENKKGLKFKDNKFLSALGQDVLDTAYPEVGTPHEQVMDDLLDGTFDKVFLQKGQEANKVLSYSVYSCIKDELTDWEIEDWPDQRSMRRFNRNIERLGGSGIEPDPEGSDVSDGDGDDNDL